MILTKPAIMRALSKAMLLICSRPQITVIMRQSDRVAP